MRRLFIVRHAAAAAAVPGGEDHDRPLSERGRAQLPGLGAAVAEHAEHSEHSEYTGHPTLDTVLCSTAARARETVNGIADAVDLPGARSATLGRLYLAGVDELLNVVRALPDDATSALVCGHNPGLHELAVTLVSWDRAPKRLRHGLPTAGLVVLDVEGSWKSAMTGSATLRAFVTPAE
jgi:phosphohistidine phosphatase